MIYSRHSFPLFQIENKNLLNIIRPIKSTYQKLLDTFEISDFVLLDEANQSDDFNDKKNLAYYSKLFADQNLKERENHQKYINSLKTDPSLPYHPLYQKILFFFFIEDSTNNNIYFALYTELNQNSQLKCIGLIIKLSDFELFGQFFVTSFQNYCIVPMRSSDYDLLSDMVDLSRTFKLNSITLSQSYEEEKLNPLIQTLFQQLDRNGSIQNKNFLIITFQLVLYYLPLITIYNDSPSLSGKFEQLNMCDFIFFQNSPGNSYAYAEHRIYLPTFELYTLHFYQANNYEKYKTETEFYKKLQQYNLNDLRSDENKKIYYKFNIIPCYGFTSDSQSNTKVFVFKFIGDTTLLSTIELGNKKYPITHLWDSTTKTLGMIQMLNSMSAFNEIGYFHNNIKPDHFFIGIRNKIYLGGQNKLHSLQEINPRDYTGNYRYLSPEKKSQGIISELSDIYSFGLVLYYYAYEKIFTDETPLESLNEDNIGRIIWNCLQKIPEMRMKSLELLYFIYSNKLYFNNANENTIFNAFISFFEFFFRKSLKNDFKDNVDIDLFLDLKFGCKNYEINSDNVCLLQHYATLVNNRLLIQQTNHFLDNIPQAHKNLLILLFKYPNDCISEIDYFAKHFDESLKFSILHSINPYFITENIMTNKNLVAHDSRLMVDYLLKLQADSSDVIKALKHYSSISSYDMGRLDLAYNHHIDLKAITVEYQMKNELNDIQKMKNDISSQISEINQKLKSNDEKMKIHDEKYHQLQNIQQKRIDLMKLRSMLYPTDNSDTKYLMKQ